MSWGRTKLRTDEHHNKHTGFALNEFSLDFAVILDFFLLFPLLMEIRNKKRNMHDNLLVAAIKGITLPIEYHLAWNQIHYY